ncbi:cation-translocating P-type ATPase [Limnoraphis robusta]|uniref:cation-translocating P-type ATPase n=1 Tax=Limnoraphis robusta TaxID=1118279 RepID=UPI002B20F7FB|nr:cation-translocating P-type ATPase [Limnoraphis robusta]MEA5496254.1 cation-translocating P-type ATPase [Limnoraphis robusta BA-68 BA1]
MASTQSSSPSGDRSSLNSPMTWHTQSIESALQLMNINPTEGLNPQQVRQKQQQYGLNEIQTTSGRQPLEILWDQFTNIMLVMLIAVAVVSAVLDLRNDNFPKDAIAIFAIVILNGLLGYFQESRAEKALAALKNLSSPKVRVLRDGEIIEIDSQQLVPGDIMFLEAGVQVAADGRLLEAQNLQVREATLTGEAEAVSKRAETELAADASLGDQINMVFQGTEVVGGRGKVLVTDTAMKTQLGQIAAMLQSVETEPTPLQQRMSQLGNVLVTGSLLLVAIVVIGGMIRAGFEYFEHLLEVSLSMAVAVVPEGLPAVVTVTLAIGTQRMVRRNALIRKLPAVETLGSVTTICSDKTGTLTQNKMVVQWVRTLNHAFLVTGEGYAPWGEFQPLHRISRDEELNPEDKPRLTPQHQQELQPLCVASVLCNDAQLKHHNDIWTILGDPTEGALLALAGKAGISKSTWDAQMPRRAEIPFSSERKRMSVICQDADAAIRKKNAHFQMFTKGSPELILERCDHVQTADQSIPLEPEHRQQILEQNDQLAAEGLRVIGFAYKPLNDLPASPDEDSSEQELIWLGLVGMLDAPRPEVREAVKRCREAGIRPVMITGDHQLTATSVAQQLGISQSGETVLTGQQLQQLSQAELEQQVKQVSVYARVAPEHKLRIVQALQKRGEFVAMTGDGVNDAPALKQADIGIAMGITGTDVSKEASDMILLDDNFATIVAATEEGRVVYSNIRRFVKYILGSNIGEVLTIAAAPLLGLGEVPLTPLQILWMNLVTDGLPALALALEPAEAGVMKRPPYSPRESIFARGLGAYMVRIGIVFSILTIVLMVWAHGEAQTSGDAGRWKTMVFTTLCLAQMGHALAVRSDTRLTVQLNPFSNPYLLAAVSLTTILQLLLIYVPPLRGFFGTHWLNGTELAICIGFSSLMFVWVEMEKLVKRWWKTRK